MIDTQGKFYLGRTADSRTGETGREPFLYDPGDLTTHAVVVGMTGSGKTGLCLDLLEEAALQGVPALMIDPKGDITNALLHFPDLSPADFRPWIDPAAARREGRSLDQVAAETAGRWRRGLADWGIGPERVRLLGERADFAVYTPGSTAGLPINVMVSLQAPPVPWEENVEILRGKIADTVTALLGLAGLREIDPVRSREHILMSRIFEHAWSRGRDLDLGELIMQVQSPPFTRLGVFDVDRFFPERDRFSLAMQLNTILAAPAFQPWLAGEPLDVQRLLYGHAGRPRHSVFYIAHLGDEERMFFVTLLYAAVESWMRTQPGSGSLRALVYFDEIAGYLPPVGNPPAKEPMLRLLKQARAFGVGMVLATQNPVDLDYKALSNAGTWFIGKLGTDQDKQRLLDGLASVAPGALARRDYDELISALGKRMFLARNVHEPRPTVFQTRWAMNYLAGPLTRAQIPALNQLAGAGTRPAAASPLPPAAAGPESPSPAPPADGRDRQDELPGTTSRPAVPSRTAEYFLPNDLSLAQAAPDLSPEAHPLGLLYHPVLLAQAAVRFHRRKYGLDHTVRTAVLVSAPDRHGAIRWEEYRVPALDPATLDDRPLPRARFAGLDAPLADGRSMRSLATDFRDWVYRQTEVTVRANMSLKVFAGPEIPEAEFTRRCQQAAAARAAREADRLEERFRRRIARLKKRLAREQRELAEDEADYRRRKMEEAATAAETLLSLFSRRRRSVSSSLTRHRMAARAREDVAESQEEIARLQRELDTLEEEMHTALDELEARWNDIAADVTTVTVQPYKKDVALELFGVAWLPFHVVTVEGDRREYPGTAYGKEEPGR